MESVSELFFAQHCRKCGSWGYPLCDECIELMTLVPLYLSLPHVGCAQVRAAGVYQGVYREIVIALKHDRRLRRSDCGYRIGLALARATAPSLARDFPRLTFAPVQVVAAPSSPRRLTHPLTREIAKGVAAGLRDSGYFRGAYAQGALSMKWFAGTQAGRDRAERLRARSGQIRLARAVADNVVIVDDVVTTGGTLAAITQTFRAANVRVLAAFALAAASIGADPLNVEVFPEEKIALERT